MPIYEYRRPDGSTFEIVQSFSDDPLTHDPDTGVPVQRVLHAPAVHFKGSGFYNTDYGTRKRQRESAAAASTGEESQSGKKESESTGEKSGGADGASKSGENTAKTAPKSEQGSSATGKSQAAAKPVATGG
jgi:putative FmdB family regulatory protein